MDAPLLALTRGPAAAIAGRSPSAVVAENMRQLIQLRWIAVAGQLFAILAAVYLLDVSLPLAPMLAVVAALAAINLLFALTLKRLVVRGELSLSLLLDMGALTAQLFFSGGSTNPFISLLLVQVVLGAILLAPAAAGLMALMACASYAFLSTRHLPLDIPALSTLAADEVILAGRWLAFAMVAVLLVLFIARITRNLRARDTYVADLAQRSAEEEGIVRMGLFASGAAHELGTPLSSLSVLIADWQRLPAFAADPALAEELAEALAEVDRCKGIVSNILHSAGQARGEAMGSTRAAAFVTASASDWQALHPGTSLDTQLGDLGEARIAAEPALRQAVWSLLDNAVEAGGAPLTLGGRIEGERVIIAVTDCGPGFGEAQLARVGTLYQSTKGPGHGLGLFLAANVARQLGGSLTARNRDGGGAEISLSLPLVATEPRP